MAKTLSVEKAEGKAKKHRQHKPCYFPQTTDFLTQKTKKFQPFQNLLKRVVNKTLV